MYFSTFTDLLYMDGHGGYVWGAYGIAALVLILLVRSPLARHAEVMQRVQQRLDRADKMAR